VKASTGAECFLISSSPFLFVYHPTGNWHCERASTLYAGIRCPEGHYKVPEEDFENLCENAGTPCPEGYTCYCKPCIEAFEVTVFPWNNDTQGASELNSDTGCAKMSLCGEAEQRKETLFRVFDNRQRDNATVTALMLFGEEEWDLPITQVEPFLYEFGFSHNERGVAILAVFFDGVQIPESPVRVEVATRDCDTDFPGKGKIPVSTSRDSRPLCHGSLALIMSPMFLLFQNAFGTCGCSGDTVEIRDACVSTDIEVSVFPWIIDSVEVLENVTRNTGCDKMSLCGTVEQTKEILFHAFDNRLRDNATVTALMHLGQDNRYLPITQVEPYLYEFGFSHSERGVAILEVFFDGVQIPASPVRVEVAARDCDTDFPGQRKIPVRRICVKPQHSSFRPQLWPNHSLTVSHSLSPIIGMLIRTILEYVNAPRMPSK
jgi:hypothetical protein